MRSCAVTLKTFSPVHIGTGKTYGPSEIVLQKDRYLRLREDAVLGYVCEQKREEEFLRDLMSGSVRVDTYIRGEIPELVRYPLLRHDLNRVFPLKDVRECVKTMDVPYIPGSSLKGAIRTAVLWKAVCADSSFVDSLRREGGGRLNKKKIGSDYFAKLLGTGEPGRRPDAKFDLLKFVEVSDMMPISGQADMLSLAGIVTHSRNSDGKLFPRNYQIPVECIPSKMEFKGNINISPQLSAALGNQKSYPHLEEKLGLLGLSSDPEDTEAMVSHLKSVCSEFSLAALKQELRLCEQSQDVCGGRVPGNRVQPSSKLREQPQDICTSLKNCQKALEINHRHLLRIGFGVGTGYQTMIHELIRQDTDLAAKWITGMKLGKYSREAYGEDLDVPYPKSVEFTTMHKPLGWIVW